MGYFKQLVGYKILVGYTKQLHQLKHDIHIYVYIYIYVCVYIYIACICIYIYIYIYLYIYMYILFHLKIENLELFVNYYN